MPSEDLSIDELEISTRARNCLLLLGVTTLRDLKGVSRETIMQIPNCGKITADEICYVMRHHGKTYLSAEEACVADAIDALKHIGRRANILPIDLAIRATKAMLEAPITLRRPASRTVPYNGYLKTRVPEMLQYHHAGKTVSEIASLLSPVSSPWGATQASDAMVRHILRRYGLKPNPGKTVRGGSDAPAPGSDDGADVKTDA